MAYDFILNKIIFLSFCMLVIVNKLNMLLTKDLGNELDF